MLELNKVMAVGNLTRDVDMRYMPSGVPVATMGLAINRRWVDRGSGERVEETVFVDVTAWDKLADFCGKYLFKGSAIFVEGRLKMDTWEDKSGGGRRTKLSVVADRIQFAESRRRDGDQQAQGQGTQPGPAPGTEPASGSTPQQQQVNTEDDLPF